MKVSIVTHEEAVQVVAAYSGAFLHDVMERFALNAGRSTTRVARAEALLAAVLHPEQLRATISGLDQAELAALQFLMKRSTGTPALAVCDVLERHLGSRQAAVDSLMRLVEGCLVLVVDREWRRLDVSTGLLETLSLYAIVHKSIAVLVPPPSGWHTVHESAPEPVTALAEPCPVARDIFLIIDEVRAKPMRVSRSGYVNQTDMKRLASRYATRVGVEPVPALEVVVEAVELALELGLLEADEELLCATRDADAFIARPPVGQIGQLLEAWVAGNDFELRKDRTLEVTPYTAASFTPTGAELRAAREQLLDALRALPEGGWWSVESISRHIYRSDPEFLIGRRSKLMRLDLVYNAYYHDRFATTYLGIRAVALDGTTQVLGDDAWDRVEGSFIRIVLGSVLVRLGVTEAGFDQNGRLVAVRLTDVGRTVLTGKPGTGESALSGPRLVVQPNFEVVVLDAMGSLALLQQLGQYSTAKTVDRAAILHLERDKVHAALATGQTIDAVVSLLERESCGPLPQNVAYTLAEWGAAYRKVTIHTGWTVLETEDRKHLDGLLALIDTRQGEVRRLSPSLAALSASLFPAVEALAAKHRVAAIEPVRSAGALLLGDDEDELALHGMASRRLQERRVLTVADAIGGERYKLTRRSMERARALGWTADTFVDAWPRFCGVPLPQGLRVRLRSWLGAYGPAQQSAVRLVRLPSWELLPFLEPQLAAVARPIGGDQLLIAEPGLAQLSELLAGYGVALQAALPEQLLAPQRTDRNSAAQPPTEPNLGAAVVGGRPLRNFFRRMIDRRLVVVFEHVAPGQKKVARYQGKPTWLRSTTRGHLVEFPIDQGGTREFNIDDIRWAMEVTSS